jgi:hypothetical protein
MESIILAIQNTPIPTVLILAGLFFILLSFVTKLGGFIEVSPEQKRFSTPIGLLVLTIGLILSFIPTRNLDASVQVLNPSPMATSIISEQKGSKQTFSVSAEGNCTTTDSEERMLMTGVNVHKGEYVQVTATGRWNAARYDSNSARESGPDGLDKKQWNSQKGIAYGALVGKVGSSQIFLVGSRYAERAETDGELSFGFWDSSCNDNSGVIDVTVVIN